MLMNQVFKRVWFSVDLFCGAVGVLIARIKYLERDV
jgi:hypothetical protein